MAILDTLIIQLGLDGSALAQGAAQAHQNLTALEQHANSTAQTLSQTGQQGADAFRTFRQEAMGALALFTGGRSLAGFGQDITHANQALSTLAQQLTATPPQLAALRQAMDPLSPRITPTLDDITHTPASLQSHNSIPQQRPSAPSTTQPLITEHASPNRALQDWATLLSRANHLTRQALQEVEPTLHNAEQALARLSQRQQHPKIEGQTTPLTMLQNLSALLTTRTILATHPPSPPSTSRTAERTSYAQPTAKAHITNTPSITLTTRTTTSPAANTPLTPASSQSTPASNQNTPTPSHILREDTSTHWARLTNALNHASATLAHQQPTLHNTTPLPPLTTTHTIAQLAHVIDTTPPRHTTTHNTTTHSPTINISVTANSQHPAEIARAVEASIAKTITRHTLAQIS